MQIHKLDKLQAPYLSNLGARDIISVSSQITGYICRLAKYFLGIEANSIDEVKINLVLMGKAYEAVSEAA